MIEEPRPRKIAGYTPATWQPWYVSISDWMIAHPSGNYTECARDLNRHILTVRYVIHSDMFQEFHAQRKAQWRAAHDFAIISRMTNVATKSLDVIMDKLDKQADKIPMQLITEIATSSLDRLGYAPQSPTGSAVSVNIDNRQQTMQVPVTAAALEEARDALRAAERKRAIETPMASLGPVDDHTSASTIGDVEP